MSWLERLFLRAGKTVLRMQPERMFAAGRYVTLPTAAVDFMGAIAVDADGVKACQPDGVGGYAWILIEAAGAGSGDVVGPAGATDNAIVRFDGATGKLIQNSGTILSDTGVITTIAAPIFGDVVDATKQVTFDISGVSTGTMRTLIAPNASGTIALTSNLSAYQPLDTDLTQIAALVDPNADRLLFWDDSAGSWAHLTLGTNLSITGTTIDASSSATPAGVDTEVQFNDGGVMGASPALWFLDSGVSPGLVIGEPTTSVESALVLVAANNAYSELRFNDPSAQVWSFGRDADSTNGKDFYIYNYSLTLYAITIDRATNMVTLTEGVTIGDATDNTKLLTFNLASITTGTTRTLTAPDLSGTLALTSAASATDNEVARFDGTTGKLIQAGNGVTISDNGNVVVPAGAAAAGRAPIKLTSGTNLTAAEAGALEYDGVVLSWTSDTTSGRARVKAVQEYRMSANGSASSPAATINDFFPATSSLSLSASSIYEFEADLYFTKSTAGTMLFTLLASSAPTAMTIGYIGPGVAITVTNMGATTGSTTAATGVTGSLSNGVNFHFRIKGYIETNLACNIRLRATPSAGTFTPLRNSTYRVRRLGSSNTGAFVA